MLFSLATLAGHLHRYLELFSHFRLQYLFVAVLLAISLFALRSRRWATLMLAIAVVNAMPVADWYLGETARTAATGTRIKILLSNLYSRNQNTDKILDLVASEKADLVFLQEFTEQRARDLAPLRDAYPYSLNIPREDHFGVAALSRHPFASARVIASPPFDYPTLVIEVMIDGRTVTFMTTHPVPPIGKDGVDARNEQLASIAAALSAIDTPRVLIGDLNTTMWGHHYKMLVEDTGLGNARSGFGVLPSWPTHLPFAMIPIDHCLVSEEFAVLDIRTGARIGSDHLPLIVTLALR